MGCGCGANTARTYIGRFDDAESLKAWLLDQKPSEPDDCSHSSLSRSEINDLLSDLGYQGEQA